MFDLTQYIIVRRDIPVEKIIVYAAHAAGKTTFAWGAKLAVDHPEARWETLNPDWGFPYRIIRGSKNESRLRKLANLCKGAWYSAEIIEPDAGPLKGQLCAIALFPGEKDKIAGAVPFLNEFHDLKWTNIPALVEMIAAEVALKVEAALKAK